VVHVQVLRKRPDEPRYEISGLVATLTPDAGFATVAPRLAALAGELRLGVDTPRSRGSLWWEAPDPSALEPGHFERAVAASRHCESREARPLLGFALAGPECLELAESHPALALLLASTARLQGRYRADIPAGERAAFLRELARRPRREILAALDFPATESMVRLLGKIPADRLNLESLRLLRDLRLAPHAAKALRHLPRFGSGLIPIVVRRRIWPHVGPELLRETAEDPDDASVFFQLRDTIDMAGELGRLGEVGVVPSRSALVGLHDRLREDHETRALRSQQAIRRREAQERAGRVRPAPNRPAPVPPPPAPARPAGWQEPPPPPPGFVPLRTADELRSEGREMKHCAGSYGRKVERGDTFIYRVLEPERATLALRWNKARGFWSVSQLRGFENRPVRPDTTALVRDWLETGVVHPEAVRWAREQARRRFHEVAERLQQTVDAEERRRLKKEMARLTVKASAGPES